MTDAQSDLIAERLDELADRVDDLEERVEAYEGLIDLRGVDGPTEASVGDIWIAGQPVGKILDGARESGKEALNRIEALEAGEIDPEALAAESEHLLPIQRRLRERKAGDEVTPANLRRATYVWEHFHERAIAESGYWKLSSPHVKSILEQHDQNTNPNTIRRVMRMVAKHSGSSDDPESNENLIQLRTGEDKNVLVADRDAWDEWAATLADDVAGAGDDQADDADNTAEDLDQETEDVDQEFDALVGADAVTSDQDDSNEQRFEAAADGGEITLS